MFDTKSMDEQDYMNATKNLTMRLRLNRDLQLNKGFTDKHLINAEYGNYQKYEKNSIKHTRNEENDMGDDKFTANYIDFMRKMPSKEAEQERRGEKKALEDVITSNRIAREQFEEEAAKWSNMKNKHQEEENVLEQQLDFL